jgi:hypothetical protein
MFSANDGPQAIDACPVACGTCPNISDPPVAPSPVAPPTGGDTVPPHTDAPVPPHTDTPSYFPTTDSPAVPSSTPPNEPSAVSPSTDAPSASPTEPQCPRLLLLPMIPLPSFLPILRLVLIVMHPVLLSF